MTHHHTLCRWMPLLMSGAILTASTGCSPTPAMAEKPAIKVFVLHGYPPMSYRDDKGNLVGFSIDLIHMLCNSMQSRCDISETTRDKVEAQLAAGEADILVPGLIVTPELQKQFLFTEPLLKSLTFWISAHPMDTPQQLRVAVLKGGVQHNWALQRQDSHPWTVIPVSVNADLIDALHNGKADAVIAPTSTALGVLKRIEQSGTDHRSQVIDDLVGLPIAIAMHPNKRELQSQLNKVIEQLRTDGQLDQLNSKHFPFRIF